SIVLASRDHTCINPSVNKLPNKNEACRELIQNANKGGGCIFHGKSKNFANFHALSHMGLQPAYDLEDLVVVGRKHKACPYYITRFLMQSADIIFCPYNYIIDPTIRKSMSMDLDGHIVIFDEAHNMEDAARESSSFSVKQDELQRSMQDCEKISKYGTEPFAHDQIAKLLSDFSQWMDTQSTNLKEKSFNSSGKCWNGTEFLGSVHAAGITQESIELHETYFAAITAQRDAQMEAVRERGNRWFEEKPIITVQTVGVIESIFRLISELSRDNGRYRDDFRVAMSKETVRQRANGNSGPFRSVQVLSVHLWCLNPAVAFEDIQKTVHSIVLTSGTLSPMQSFESELGAEFPLKLEASHVIDKHQVWAGIIGTGPNGVSLNGSYQNTETLKYQDELGEILYRVCNTMPHGVLCFFPSYRMLDTLCNRWTETNVMARIEKDKVVVKEPRSGPDSFQEAMDSFYEAIEESTKNSGCFTRTGALFLAVYRGKVSEGLDFADNNARAVLCIGIPFPNVRDMQVELKREYNTKNTSRGLLAGGEWYEIQAFRALNQALGRCIRHRKDWGAIFLVDDRYLRTPRYVNSLSKWIRSSVSKYQQWSFCEASLRQFRDRMKALEHPLASDLSNCMGIASSSTCVSSETHGGAHDKGSESWIGMKNDHPNWSGLSSGKETKSVIPFANSFSGYGNAIDSHNIGTDKLAASSNNAGSFSSPSGRKENEPNPNFTFTTPLSIFSKKGSSRRPEKPDSIASMFANQLQKNDSTDQDKFDPSQVSVSQSESTVPDVGSSEFIIGSGQKRGRERKMKL
ncbi:Fanconi anemia group J protein, partial [Orchesella cincta]